MKLLTSALISASMIGAVPAAAVAQTSSASKLSVVSARAGAPSGQSRILGDEGAGGIIALALVAGIVAIGVLAATQDDSPNSP